MDRRSPRHATPGRRRAAHDRRDVVVDVHSHFFPDRFLRALMREGPAHGVRVEERDGERLIWNSPHQSARIGPVFYDVPARLEAVERWGISVQALSLSPPMLYWAPSELARELARTFNEEVAAVCRAHPHRFVALATLPLQDVDAAVAEAERAARAGCRGVYIGTNVRGRYLDAPEFAPLYETAQRLGLPVFTHPLNNAGEERMERWHLANSVGNPGETALAAGRLIMSGTLERFPRLTIVLAHAGGSLPFVMARMDHAYAVRRECQTAIPRRPSAYLKRVYFDTITHGDASLAFLIHAAGPSRVLLGSDHPYDMADVSPARRVRRLGLSPAAEQAICHRNAQRLLRLGRAG
jgi:aminocarboxymuconate-semialdehyde decarboxylase